MNQTTRTLVLGTLLMCSLPMESASAAGSNEIRREDGDNPEPQWQSKPLEGTWRVQITIRNCQTGEALRSFPAMATYSRGRTLITSDSGFSPALRSPGHGVWSHTAAHSYSAVSEAFLFNASGALTGVQRIAQTIEVGGPDAFEASVSSSISDLNGNVLARGCATSVGRRLE